MEQRYNSNKVLDYKKTPKKSKKRSLNGSANNSFVASSKTGSRHNLKEPPNNYSKDHMYSDRRIKAKKYDKRSMSSGIRKARDLYLGEDAKNSSRHTSNKKDKSANKRYEDSSQKSSKSKQKYAPTMNYYFSQPSASNVNKVIKQHSIARKHVDHKVPVKYMGSEMFTPGNSGKVMNNSTVIKKSNINSQQLHKSRRMNDFKPPPNKSRDHNHYRINSNSHSNKISQNRSSSVVHPTDLTPLHSNWIKTVKTKQTNDETLIGSNAYKISTMENSTKKNMKKSLNLSSNQYLEYPTNTDWYSSLVNPTDDNIEEIHFYFVMLNQKKRRIIDRIEKANKNVAVQNKRSKRRTTKRSGSAKRRRGDSGDSYVEPELQYEFITQKNSNIELWVQDMDIY
jgi:hypothetical protein